MAHVVKNLLANAGDTRDTGLIPGSRKISWKRKWQPTPVFLPGKSHGQGSLVGYSPGGLKEVDMTEHSHARHARLDSPNKTKPSFVSPPVLKKIRKGISHCNHRRSAQTLLLFFFKFFYFFLNFKIFNSYMHSQTWNPLPPPSPQHLSGSSPCSNFKVFECMVLCFI